MKSRDGSPSFARSTACAADAGCNDVYPDLQQTTFDLYDQLNAAPLTLEPTAPSQVPALILAGEYGNLTPPAYGQLAAETLPNSYFFQFPGFGHVELFQEAAPTGPPSCAMPLIAQFLDDPTHAPDGSCVAAIPPPHFVGS